MTTLEATYLSGHALLRRYADALPTDRAVTVLGLRPRAEDYGRLFGPDAVASDAAARYLKLWTALPVWPIPPSPTFAVCCATSDELKTGAGDAKAFPTGYREISCWLRPGVTWALFHVAHAGRFQSALIDGLAEVEPGRWVWCPQPWRVLPPPPPPSLYWD